MEIKRIKYEYNFDVAYQIFIRICSGIFGKQIEITDIFKKTVENLIKYLMNDEKCSLNGLKSIGIIGNTGSRKTFLFEAIKKFISIDEIKYIRFNKIIPFDYKIFSSREIVGEYQKIGYDAIEKFCTYNIICIDDLGTEDEGNHYGNKMNVIEAIFEERYLSKKFTHFSSNFDIINNSELFINKYGQRVYSRIIQTTNIIKFVDKDFRLIN